MISTLVARPAPFPGPPAIARLAGRLGLGAFALFVAIGLGTALDNVPRSAAGAVLALGTAAPIFLGRPRAWLGYAAIATAGVTLLGQGNAHAIAWFALVVLAAWCVFIGDRRAALGCWIASVLLLGGEWLWAVRDAGWGPWIAGVTISVLAAALLRHQFVLVERLRAAQEALVAQSRAEERTRIARELHDVLAHSLTVALLHVSSARLAVEHDPADAVRALAEAERLSRESLTEVRATMGLLQDAPAGVTPPVPGVDQLPALVAQLRNAGADVTLRSAGDRAAVPATTGAAVYRIIQEALTNASKHAPGSLVQVDLRVRSTQVELCVDSAGAAGRGAGMGLTSMRERAAAVGGVCTAGPGGRGWLVQATLPIDTSR